MNFEKIVEAIERVAPPELAEEWDNSGVQIGFGNQEIKKILFCLDITEDVITEAIEEGCQMIVSHHPLIFNPVFSIDEKLYGVPGIVSHYINLLIKNNISVYSAHTSFDNAPKGNNYFLASIMDLKDVTDPADPSHIGVKGALKIKTDISCVVKKLEDVLNLPKGYVRCTGNRDIEVSKIAVCTGAGGDFLKDPFIEDCDMLITGDVKLNQAMESNAMGIAVADAGHFGTEQIFARNIIELLKKENIEVEMRETTVNTNPYMV